MSEIFEKIKTTFSSIYEKTKNFVTKHSKLIISSIISIAVFLYYLFFKKDKEIIKIDKDLKKLKEEEDKIQKDLEEKSKQSKEQEKIVQEAEVAVKIDEKNKEKELEKNKEIYENNVQNINNSEVSDSEIKDFLNNLGLTEEK